MLRLLEGVEAEITRAGHGGIAAVCRIGEAHPDFEGHFDARPVLPACSQFEILEALARAGLDASFTFAAVPRAKFLGVIDPGSRLEIGLAPTALADTAVPSPHGPASAEFEFTISRNGKIVTRGKIRFERAARAVPGGDMSARPSPDLQ